jgi:toxin-antitoxin system PIN domain toxin
LIAVDTNVLVYAHRADAPLHDRAVGAVTRLAESRTAWAIPWPCVHEFVAIVTHPRIFDPPTGMGAATDQVAAWMESPSLVLISETTDHWSRLVELVSGSGVVGPRIHDARVATICLSHGVSRLWTLDRDFSRFTPLRTINPLA